MIFFFNFIKNFIDVYLNLSYVFHKQDGPLFFAFFFFFEIEVMV